MTFHPHPYLHHHKRRSLTCHRHPSTEPITGFCASCLRERLDCIQNKSPTTTAAIAPHLRRSKSFSGGPNPSSASASEPSRRSCEARCHNTLHNLFSVDDRVENPNPAQLPCSSNVQSIQVFQDLEEEGEFKTMKEFIDLEWGNSSTSRKSFWESASVFSKKLSKWRHKQSKKKKQEDFKRSNPTRFRETQSEVGEYGLRRRSCDTDPRLSVDIGRLSVDDYRLSLDEPRASWDGYLIGRQNPSGIQVRLVGEDVNGEERLGVVKEEESYPGGSVQTRDYYGDSASWHPRRRSLDWSGSTRRMSFVESDEVKLRVSNERASPEPGGLFHGAKLLVTEKELRDSNWYSLKDFRLKSVQSAPTDFGAGVVAAGVGEERLVHQKESWGWRKLLRGWGLRETQKESNDKGRKSNVGNGIVRQGSYKLRMAVNGHAGVGAGDERFRESLQKLRMVGGGGVCEGSLAESLQKLRRVANGDANENDDSVVCEKLVRSYSVSRGSSCRLSSSEMNGNGEKVVLQNRSVRYCANTITNGLVNFSLTPLRRAGKIRESRSGSGEVG